MNTLLAFCAPAALAAAAFGASLLPQAGPELGPGDPAPAFSLPGSDGKTHTLAELKGKTAVVLAWFPKAFTGG